MTSSVAETDLKPLLLCVIIIISASLHGASPPHQVAGSRLLSAQGRESGHWTVVQLCGFASQFAHLFKMACYISKDE